MFRNSRTKFTKGVGSKWIVKAKFQASINKKVISGLALLLEKVELKATFSA